MKNFIVVIAVLFLSLLGTCGVEAISPPPSALIRYTGTLVKIYDGDTIVVQDEEGEKHRVRFYGIDAPELRQAGGEESLQNLMKLMSDTKVVKVEVQNVDLYGREVALVYRDKLNLNRQQLMDGYAWHYKQYDRLFKEEFAVLEQKARERRVGIWRFEQVLEPWEYRRNKTPPLCGAPLLKGLKTPKFIPSLEKRVPTGGCFDNKKGGIICWKH